MSEYIHEIVLQEYICENILDLKLSVKYKTFEQCSIVAARIAIRNGESNAFWDLEGKLENGVWIPIEVEWISTNFTAHKHHTSKGFNKFVKENGVLLTLRRNKEIDKVQQIAILDNLSEAQFKSKFQKWFKSKSNEYIDKTLDNYLVGNYVRSVPRVLLYPLSKAANRNYFAAGSIYQKYDNSPCLLGFKEDGFQKNALVRDIQPDDVCVFLYNNRTYMARKNSSRKFMTKRLCSTAWQAIG